MFWTRIHQARTSTRLAPATHRNEFQQGIPWRVALQQSPPPLPPLEPVLPQQPPSRQLFAANGELSRYTLSHKRAHPKPPAVAVDQRRGRRDPVRRGAGGQSEIGVIRWLQIGHT